ncbi:MAG TPA: hypothetical protein GXX75_06835 [Clostridiales bacterium]|nr:hypothetical protein [Clostridiales bacterium]
MEFNGRLEMKDINQLLKDRGLQDTGPVQKFIDSEVIRLMSPYIPMRDGMLDKSAAISTVIGSGLVRQEAPHVRFQYYGKVMVDPETGSPFAGKGVKKVLTDKDLMHDKSRHPQAGPFWFERMKADKQEDILEGSRKVAGAK